MNKELIPNEQALELKELGFDEPCFAYYNIMDYKGNIEFDIRILEGSVNYIEAPLYQQAFRWFREKHQIQFYIRYYADYVFKGYIIEIKLSDIKSYTCNEPTYEEAEFRLLRELIQIAKNK